MSKGVRESLSNLPRFIISSSSVDRCSKKRVELSCEKWILMREVERRRTTSARAIWTGLRLTDVLRRRWIVAWSFTRDRDSFYFIFVPIIIFVPPLPFSSLFLASLSWEEDFRERTEYRVPSFVEQLFFPPRIICWVCPSKIAVCSLTLIFLTRTENCWSVCPSYKEMFVKDYVYYFFNVGLKSDVGRTWPSGLRRRT